MATIINVEKAQMDSNIDIAIIAKFIEISPVLGINDKAFHQALLQTNNTNNYYKFPYGVKSLLEEIDNYITKEAIKRTDLSKGGISGRMEALIRNRLLIFLEFKNYRAFLKQKKWFAVTFKNSAFALSQIYKIADDLWYAMGDNSSDFSFYTKRMTLTALYSAVILKFMNDYSYDFADTFNFLHNRINNIVAFSKFKYRAQKLLIHRF